MRETIEINTVQEYISKLDDLSEGGDNYFFRGEPSINYERVIASAYRPYNSLFNKGDVFIDYKDLIKEYYLEIANDLSEIDRINFMHYAQHHGMPTPLVDITSNPFTALFFATSSNFKENQARVHVYDKRRLLDFSTFKAKNEITLTDFFFNNDFTRHLYLSMLKLPEIFKNDLIEKCAENLRSVEHLRKREQTDGIGKYLDPTICHIIREVYNTSIYKPSDLIKRINYQFNKHFTYNRSNLIDKNTYNYELIYQDSQNTALVLDLPFPHTDLDKTILIILILIQGQIEFLKQDLLRGGTPERYLKLHDRYDIVFPLIVDHPKMRSGRMKSQEGTFLYQLTHYAGKSNRYISFTKIDNDAEIIINDKEKIFRTLNRIGVNQKTIFPDHDNIATYLKTKHLM